MWHVSPQCCTQRYSGDNLDPHSLECRDRGPEGGSRCHDVVDENHRPSAQPPQRASAHRNEPRIPLSAYRIESNLAGTVPERAQRSTARCGEVTRPQRHLNQLVDVFPPPLPHTLGPGWERYEHGNPICQSPHTSAVIGEDAFEWPAQTAAERAHEAERPAVFVREQRRTRWPRIRGCGVAGHPDPIHAPNGRSIIAAQHHSGARSAELTVHHPTPHAGGGPEQRSEVEA